MKKIIIILALLMFLKPLFPVLEYAVNYNYISKVLCVNKDKPMLHCNGKCHLMKELAKASENEKPINSDKKNNFKQEVEVLFYQDIKSLIVEQVYFQNKITVSDYYSNLYYHTNSFSVFHPPTLA